MPCEPFLENEEAILLGKPQSFRDKQEVRISCQGGHELLLFLRAGVLEVLPGVRRKVESLLGLFEPAGDAGFRLLQHLFKLCFFLKKRRLPFLELRLVDLLGRPHVDEPFDLFGTGVVGAALGGEDSLALHSFHLVFLPELGEGPIPEDGGDLDVGHKLVDLGLQCPLLNQRLGAAGFRLLGAMVIDVGMGVAILLVLHPLLGRDHGATASAAHDAHVLEPAPGLRPRPTFATQKLLDAPELFLGHHRLVGALPRLAAVGEDAVVERAREHAVYHGSAHGLPALALGGPGREAPFLRDDLEYLWRGIGAGQHHVPHLPHEREAFGVFYDCVRALLVRLRVQISQRRDAGHDTHLHLGLEAPLHVHGEVAHVLVRHAEFHLHHEDVVGGEVGALLGLDALDRTLLEHPAHAPAVHGVSRQAVKFPTEDALVLALGDRLEHLAEYRPSGRFGRAGFLEDGGDLKMVVFGYPSQFRDLGVDGEDLAVFVLGALAGVYYVLGFFDSHLFGLKHDLTIANNISDYIQHTYQGLPPGG